MGELVSLAFDLDIGACDMPRTTAAYLASAQMYDCTLVTARRAPRAPHGQVSGVRQKPLALLWQ